MRAREEVVEMLTRELRAAMHSDASLGWKYGSLRAVVAFAIEDLGGENLWPEITASYGRSLGSVEAPEGDPGYDEEDVDRQIDERRMQRAGMYD